MTGRSVAISPALVRGLDWRLLLVVVAVLVTTGGEWQHHQKLPVFDGVGRRANRRAVRLHDKEPGVIAEEIGGINDAAGFPDARPDGWRHCRRWDHLGARRIQFDHAFGGETVLQVMAPDAAVAGALGILRRLCVVPSSWIIR